MSTPSTLPSHECSVCCKILAPRSYDAKIIKKAIEHHIKDVHTEKPLYWPTSGLPVLCEEDCCAKNGCGEVIYDSYEFTSGEMTFVFGMSYATIISIEKAEDLGIKAMCGSCAWK